MRRLLASLLLLLALAVCVPSSSTATHVPTPISGRDHTPCLLISTVSYRGPNTTTVIHAKLPLRYVGLCAVPHLRTSFSSRRTLRCATLSGSQTNGYAKFKFEWFYPTTPVDTIQIRVRRSIRCAQRCCCFSPRCASTLL